MCSSAPEVRARLRIELEKIYTVAEIVERANRRIMRDSHDLPRFTGFLGNIAPKLTCDAWISDHRPHWSDGNNHTRRSCLQGSGCGGSVTWPRFSGGRASPGLSAR